MAESVRNTFGEIFLRKPIELIYCKSYGEPKRKSIGNPVGESFGETYDGTYWESFWRNLFAQINFDNLL
jgi:hypothetical protein